MRRKSANNGPVAEPGIRYLRDAVTRLGPAAPGTGAIGGVVIGRGDRRPFIGDSELRPLARLARYRPEAGAVHDRPTWTDPVRQMLDLAPAPEDGRFLQVRAGDLTDVPRVYVFVHGWVPGSRDFTEELYVEAGRVPMAWDDRVANKVGLTMVEAYEPLLAALAQRDPQAAVLWYSWVDQSGTDTDVFAARSSLRFTGVNGRRLAAALDELIGDGQPQLHLIGHSHGSVVATYAGLSMHRRIAHLTLLDCPEDWFSRAGGAAGLLPDILPRLRPGRGPGATFVDSYASMFGRSYHDDAGLDDVVDVRLTPAVRRSDEASAVSQAHQFPVTWYAGTVADPEAAGGFAWSPLHGFDTTALGSAYLATSRGRMAELIHRRGSPRAQPQQSFAAIGHEPQQLTRRSPDVAYVMALPPDAILIEFDLGFARPAKDTRIDIALDGQLACSIFAASPVPARGRFVRVAPGRSTLQFRLIGGGYRTTASVSGLRVLRGQTATRNLDDSAAMVRAAALGAAAGALATVAVLGSVLGLRTLARRVLSPSGER